MGSVGEVPAFACVVRPPRGGKPIVLALAIVAALLAVPCGGLALLSRELSPQDRWVVPAFPVLAVTAALLLGMFLWMVYGGRRSLTLRVDPPRYVLAIPGAIERWGPFRVDRSYTIHRGPRRSKSAEADLVVYVGDEPIVRLVAPVDVGFGGGLPQPLTGDWHDVSTRPLRDMVPCALRYEVVGDPRQLVELAEKLHGGARGAVSGDAIERFAALMSGPRPTKKKKRKKAEREAPVAEPEPAETAEPKDTDAD